MEVLSTAYNVLLTLELSPSFSNIFFNCCCFCYYFPIITVLIIFLFYLLISKFCSSVSFYFISSVQGTFFSILLYLCSVLSFCPKEKVLTPSVSVLWILNTDTSPSGHEFLVSAHLKSKHNLNSWVNRVVPVWKGRSWIELTYLCKFTSRNFLDATQLGV